MKFEHYDEIFQKVKKAGWSSTALLNCAIDKNGNVIDRKRDYFRGDRTITVEVDDIHEYQDQPAYSIPSYSDFKVINHWKMINCDLSELQLYLEITDRVPSRKGSIGLLTQIAGDESGGWIDKSIISFDNKKQFTVNGNILSRWQDKAVLKLGYTGPTKYIFVRKPAGEAQEIAPIKTKYNQTLNKDDFVFAAMCRFNKPYLVAGIVTRWTAAGNLFVKPIYNIGATSIQNKNGEVMIASGQEVVKLPQEDVEKHLLMVGLGS